LKSPDEITKQFQQRLEAINNSKFGLELDCDAIANFPSSAKSPVGFSVNQIRNFINIASENKNCCYFHICEAAPDEQNAAQVGKTISYFVSDFMSR